MGHRKTNPVSREKLTGDVLKEWQGLIDSAAEMFGVPAGLITRVDGDRIEILLSSKSKDNPYTAGCSANYPDSGWFCERTLKIRDLYLISDARQDPMWSDNPAVARLNMVSYIGMPILRPNGKEFGTVCFLDNRANPHNNLHIKILRQITRMIELTLRIIYDKEVMARQDGAPRLEHALSDCSYCRTSAKLRGVGPRRAIRREVARDDGFLRDLPRVPEEGDERDQEMTRGAPL